MRAKTRIALVLAAFLPLAGCTAMDVQNASEAESELVGATTKDLLSCLGAPGSSIDEGGSSFWTYTSSGLRVIGERTRSLSCRATFEIHDGVVVNVRLASSGHWLLGDAECGALLSPCVQ